MLREHYEMIILWATHHSPRVGIGHIVHRLGISLANIAEALMLAASEMERRGENLLRVMRQQRQQPA